MKKITSILLFSLFSLLAFTSCKKDDPCDTAVCLNDATCINGSCLCTTGYEGTHCDTEMRTKFLGQWNGTISCGPDPAEDISTVIINGTNIQAIIIDLDGPLIGIINGSTVTFEQQASSDDMMVSGTGQIVNDILTMDFNVSDNIESWTCQIIITK